MLDVTGSFDAYFNPNFTAILGMFLDFFRAVLGVG